MVLLVINIIIAILALYNVMNAKQADINRGTNTFTKFVRDVGANATYTYVSSLTTLVTVVFLLISLFTKLKFIPCLPTAAVTVLCFILKSQSNKSKERVKVARQVTKNSLEIGAAAGSTAGKAVGAVIGTKLGGTAGAKAGSEVGGAVGNALGSVSKHCADAMIDCESMNIGKEDFKQIETFTNPELFMQKAKALGMVNEGDDVVTVAERIMSYAPSAALQSLPDNASLEDKAMLLLEGKV